MRWIDYENRKPTEAIPGYWDKPWTSDQWQAWLKKSKEYHDEVERLHDSGKIKERNAYIDAKSKHWGKLKPWLAALSKGKCWFTEGRDICSHLDVEHFRPKKEAKDESSERDGYWWLAFDFTNFRFAGNAPNRKKSGWFPLHEDSCCSTFRCRCEETETPYLLDPIRKVDTDLIAYDEEGNAVSSVHADTEWEKARVAESIERLKLNEHDALPEERRRIWQLVSRYIEQYLSAKQKYRPAVNTTPLETMERAAREIRKLTSDEAELSCVAICCVLFRNDPKLNRLIA
tara:strand:+ start:1848 stop:2708 length:861 start_codon:yes stop_codon:yes gene_type:complete